jgi:hypothetical protein
MKQRRHVNENAADMAKPVVADLLHDTDPADLAGYMVIGLLSDGSFKMASNAKDDKAEITILRTILSALEAL